jgi:hypothetical protein
MAGIAPTAAAAGISKQRVAAIAKRGATARVERFGINHALSAWEAGCGYRSGGAWRCAVGTGGQCSGVVTIAGTSVSVRSCGRSRCCASTDGLGPLITVAVAARSRATPLACERSQWLLRIANFATRSLHPL